MKNLLPDIRKLLAANAESFDNSAQMESVAMQMNSLIVHAPTKSSQPQYPTIGMHPDALPPKLQIEFYPGYCLNIHDDYEVISLGYFVVGIKDYLSKPLDEVLYKAVLISDITHIKLYRENEHDYLKLESRSLDITFAVSREYLANLAIVINEWLINNP